MVVFPFTAIVGQEKMKKALILNAINPKIGGVLIRGEKGTAKSTTVRALAELLPEIEVVENCPFNCNPNGDMCDICKENKTKGTLKTIKRKMKVVDLPIGSTEDRVIGTLDIERAIKEGVKALEPGILAEANRNILYIDEVNLLDDHIVDILLDAAAMGWNTIEREGIKVKHPSNFILVGTMNPEEGELRPQILDRFGLMVDVEGLNDVKQRVEVIKRVEKFNTNPDEIFKEYEEEQIKLREKIENARKILDSVKISDDLLELISKICIELNIPTNRADITVARTAKTIASFNGRDYVNTDDIKEACELALPHRMRRKPFEPPQLNNEKIEEMINDFEKNNENNKNDENDKKNNNNQNENEEENKNGQEDNLKKKLNENDKERKEQDEKTDVHDDNKDKEDKKDNPNENDNNQNTNNNSNNDNNSNNNNDKDNDSNNKNNKDSNAQEQMFNAKGGINPNIIKIQLKDNISRYSSGRHVKSISKKGRYIKYRIPNGKTTDIAFDATLRASALYQKDRKEKSDNKNVALYLKKEDLREKIRERKISTNILFSVDASGSMGAMKRMEAAKGAVVSLLMDAYQKRNKVSMITFRKDSAELLLPFTSSVELAEKCLSETPTGGKTPLSKAFLKSYEVIKNNMRKNPNIIPIVVFISDFKPNVAMEKDYIKEVYDICEKFAEDEINVILIDTEPKSFIKIGIGENIAKKYGFKYYKIDDLSSENILNALN